MTGVCHREIGGEALEGPSRRRSFLYCSVADLLRDAPGAGANPGAKGFRGIGGKRFSSEQGCERRAVVFPEIRIEYPTDLERGLERWGSGKKTAAENRVGERQARFEIGDAFWGNWGPCRFRRSLDAALGDG